jgi:hypothetical protein
VCRLADGPRAAWSREERLAAGEDADFMRAKIATAALLRRPHPQSRQRRFATASSRAPESIGWRRASEAF